MSGRRSVQRGIALVLVLWVLTLLTIIAVGMTMAQRTESTLIGNQVATAHFHALAEAGVGWAVLNLLVPPLLMDEETEVWVPDGAPRFWTFAGATLRIRVFDEASRVDLNAAPRDLLKALFRAVNLEEDEANALADAIEDWRDTDDLTGLNGAEDRDYVAAGRPHGAKDGPFDSVEELRLVLGIDRDLYRILFPVLTVNTRDTGPNQRFAPPLVRAILMGRATDGLGPEALVGADDSGVNTIDRGGPLYRVRVTHLADNGPGMSMEALVRVEASGSPRFSVLWRRFGLAAEYPVVSAGEGNDESGISETVAGP